MAPVSRETVLQAVEEYGIAWTTQDPKRIGRLFTKDAIYVERSFDKNATFRGREAIVEYWNYQICGKQSNVRFRHVDAEMVRDADRPMAVVKWLAEFDNYRLHRGAEKARKRVQFCQMAKLIFEEEEAATASDDDDETNRNTNIQQRICYLEEYAQGINGKSYVWPGLDATDDELWDRIRMEPPNPKKDLATIPCRHCGALFPSRTKLMQHVQFTDAHYSEEENCVICVPNEAMKEQLKQQYTWICLSLSFDFNRNDDDTNNNNYNTPQQWLLHAISNVFGTNEGVTLTWAIPTELISSAIVTVVSVKFPQLLLQDLDDDDITSFLPQQLNESLPTTTTTKQHTNDNTMTIHTAGIVNLPCAPERREFEFYAAILPWNWFCPNNSQTKTMVYIPRNKKEGPPHHTLEEGETNDVQQLDNNMTQQQNDDADDNDPTTTIIEGIDAKIIQRLRHGTRLMKDFGRNEDDEDDQTTLTLLRNHVKEELSTKLRIRAKSMKEFRHAYCKLSLSMRPTVPGQLERVVELLLRYVRYELDDDALRAALQNNNHNKANPNDNNNKRKELLAPLLTLVEPAVTRYENKVKLRLCRFGKTNTALSKTTQMSMDAAEQAIFQRIIRTHANNNDFLE